MMLEQALQLSREMVTIVESGEELERLEALELQRKSILQQYAEVAEESVQKEDAERLLEIQQLNETIREKLQDSRIAVRDQLVRDRKSKRQIKAYG